MTVLMYVFFFALGALVSLALVRLRPEHKHSMLEEELFKSTDGYYREKKRFTIEVISYRESILDKMHRYNTKLIIHPNGKYLQFGELKNGQKKN